MPSTAKPGYSYWFGFQHVDASGDSQPLYVETAYQVCTIKPSKASVTKGTDPCHGHRPHRGPLGSQLGPQDRLSVWHKGTAPVPTTQKAKKSWFQVGKSLKCTGTGAYATPYFRAGGLTGTFLVYYEGDDWYRAGSPRPPRSR